MKRSVCLFLLVLLCLTVLTGCFQKREIIAPEYTYEILIDKEQPDESFVWAGEFMIPPSSRGFLPIPKSNFWGIVEDGTVLTVESGQKDKYIKSYVLANGMSTITNMGDLYPLPEAEEAIADFLGISIEKLYGKFNMSLYRKNCMVWKDATLFHFFVPENNAYEAKETEYAGKYVFIEHIEKTDETHVLLLTPEDYGKDISDEETSQNTNGVEELPKRLGNRLYLTCGYYDLSDHSYNVYEEGFEMPEIILNTGIDDDSFIQTLKEDALFAPYPDEDVLSARRKYYRIGDRIYAAITLGEKYHEEESGSYGGSDLLLFMLDANTFEVLYAERYHSTNYYMGTEMMMYQKGADGFLYDLYLEE